MRRLIVGALVPQSLDEVASAFVHIWRAYNLLDHCGGLSLALKVAMHCYCFTSLDLAATPSTCLCFRFRTSFIDHSATDFPSPWYLAHCPLHVMFANRMKMGASITASQHDRLTSSPHQFRISNSSTNSVQVHHLCFYASLHICLR